MALGPGMRMSNKSLISVRGPQLEELQSVELDILEAVLDVCHQLGLSYYMVCGSVMGAVKYKGFVPWDDDIDLALPRRDYEEFLRRAPALLPGYYFVQNHRTEAAFPHMFTKVRDSRTTFIEATSRRLNVNHGVFIDVFPLDGYPSKKASQMSFEVKKWLYKRELYSAFDYSEWLRQAFYAPFRLAGCPKRIQSIAASYEAMLTKYPLETSELWCNHGNWQGRLEYAPREQYGEGVEAEFEGLKVRIPARYDEYLTQKYGNWRADLPKERQVGHHYYVVCDTERPYTEYLDYPIS